MISKALDKAQFNLAAVQAQWYLTNVALDDVLAAQQRSFYADRRSILHEPNMRARISSILEDVITAEVERALGAGSGPDALVRELARLCPVAECARGYRQRDARRHPRSGAGCALGGAAGRKAGL